MRRINFLLALTFCVSATSFDQAVTAAGFEFDDSITAEHRELILGDLDALGKTNFTQSEEVQRLLEINEVSGLTLIDWLRERVRTLVGERFLPYSRIMMGPRWRYAHADSVGTPHLFRPMAEPVPDNILVILLGPDGKASVPIEALKQMSKGTIAENVSAEIYGAGKTLGRASALLMSDGSVRHFPSLRRGIVRLRDGFFKWDRYHRLAALFHEARHSDGNGRSLAFSHVSCDFNGNDFDGACDYAENGAYAVHAALLKLFLMNCRQCSGKDIERMSLKIVTYRSRIIPATWDKKPWFHRDRREPKSMWLDATPEDSGALNAPLDPENVLKDKVKFFFPRVEKSLMESDYK